MCVCIMEMLHTVSPKHLRQRLIIQPFWQDMQRNLLKTLNTNQCKAGSILHIVTVYNHTTESESNVFPVGG